MEHDEPFSHLVAMLLGGGVPGLGSLGVMVWYVKARLRQIDQLRIAERRAKVVEALLRQVVEQVVAEQNRQSTNVHKLRNWCMQLGFGLKPEQPPDWEAGQIQLPRLPSDTHDEDESEP